MTDLKVGLIGAGWMGKAHAMSYRTQRLAFEGKPAAAVLEVVADANEEIAARAAAEMGFRRHARDWREVVDDPGIDIVDITTPNDLHFDIAMAAIAAGKHIWCEKPLTNDVGTSFEMAEAAAKAGITTMVGFNYIKNPVQTLARKLIEDGEIGAVTYYRGLFNSDFLGRPDIPHSWRNDKARAGSGVIGDVGAHCFAYFRQPGEPADRRGDVRPQHPGPRAPTGRRRRQVQPGRRERERDGDGRHRRRRHRPVPGSRAG